ncbi:MAG TPA: lamin tail domain-containing protein, partial [Verrucomicrobiae bacterium]
MRAKLIEMKTALLPIACALCAMSQTSSADLNTGLVSYWPLDAISGGATPDLLLSNNLAVFGGPSVAPGVFSNAFSFNGSSQYLDIAHSTTPTRGLPIYAGGAYSIAFWVRGASQVNHYVFTEADTANANPIFILQTGSVSPYGGQLDVIIRNNSGTLIDHTRSASTVFDGSWHHVGWVDNNGAVSLYVDGKLDTANFNYTPGAAGLIPLNNTAVGALVRTGSPTINFNGSVDDVALWARALSQAEVQSMMSGSMPLPLRPPSPAFIAPFTASTNARGDYVILSGAAAESQAAYQWFENGTLLAGQTNSTLGPIDTTAAGTNVYTIEATGYGGTVTNSAPVVVLPDAVPNLASGLVNYWPFDAVSKSSTPDLASGDSILLNSMTAGNLVPGVFGESLDFAGSPECGVRAGGGPVFSGTNYSVSAWVQGEPSTQAIFYGESSTNDSTPLFILSTAGPSSGALDVLVRNDANVALLDNLTSAQTVFDGAWHHIVWVDQNGRAMLYVDGALDPVSFSYTRAGAFPLTTSCVGALVRAAVNDYFAGAVDDLAVWNRRLSYAEIQQLQTNSVEAPAENTNAPVLLAASSAGLNQVQVVLSAPVTPASATNPANYSLTGPGGIVPVINAGLDASHKAIGLGVGGMSAATAYILTVNNLTNEFAPSAVIAANSTIGFAASLYAPEAIGISPASGGQLPGSNGVALTSTGGDIGGAADQFEYSCVPVSGNFDFTVNLTSLGMSDVWAKGGLMARESLAANARFAASLATPGMSGAVFEFRDPTNSAAVRAGSFPVNYPDTWLRLSRAGNVFTAYASYDGAAWTQTGSEAISMPPKIYFGMAASSHNATESTTARFINPVPAGTNAVIGGTANPHEPLGPCSRKTGIVFSEIMWKPAPRADGNNLEFVELNNTTPYFHDISGYQIVCADMNYTIPPGTILAGGAFLALAASPGSIESVYGITNVLGPYTGSLKKSETLELLDEQGAVLLTVPYTGAYPWPVATDATGHSLVLAYPSYGEGDPRAWDISDIVGGSPGVMETFHPSALRGVVINEILAHSENPAVPQFVELYNHSAVNVDLTGCILTDDFATNKFVIPSGTTVGPDGYVSFSQGQLGFTLNGAGETLYFINPDGSRVLDAVQFEAQADGVSLGRWPNGANDFYPMAAPTPGAANSAIQIGAVAINELMYDPISGNDDDQYIELYNQSSNAVSVANWQFTAGVSFTFPANAAIPAGGYLVVARNQTNLFGSYTNLNSVNTVGNYTGKLSHNGERVALAMPQSLHGTNTIYVVQDEVTYGAGGRWGQWSSGGGSSLELIDPHSNHRLAANWADSDETQKSAWTNVQSTSVLEYGANFESSIAHAQIGLLDTGECLVDNIEVDDAHGANYVTNSTFESGLSNWLLQGCMVRSSLENTGCQSAHSLHIRCTDRLWTGDNSCQVPINVNSFVSNSLVTLKFEARWLHGWPEAVLRLNGNWEEAAGRLPVPRNLGTPGAPNSARVTNAGPAIYNVTHSPSVPAAGQAVVVTAQVHDPDGLQSMVLKYRVDPATTYTTIPMRDDALGADVIARDGIYSASIPGQKAGAIVAFYISAADNPGATTRFPALTSNNAPVQECLVMFGDGNPGGSFGVYHLWVTQANATRWSNLGPLSNEFMDGTFVNNNRVIYNMSARFAGSPSHQSFNTPNGNLCHYKWEFNDDDKFLGATDFNKIHQPGNSPGDDGSLQREQTAYTFLRALGQPWLYRRYVVVFVNGSQRGTLMEDTQAPGSDVVKEHFPNDSDGFLYKMQPWTEFGPATTSPFSFESFCNIMPYVSFNGQKKASRYRYMFDIRRTPDSDNNFTNVFSLVDAASSYVTANYAASMEGMANMENWMQVFAANHAAGNRDVFGALTAQNLYSYIGQLGTPFTLLMWDFNYVLDHGEWAPGQNLFTTNPQDPDTAQIYTNVTFRRMYWRALGELANGPLLVANTAPLCNAKYNAFAADGFNVENPNAAMLPWIGQAQASIASQLAAVDAASFTVNPSVIVNSGVAYISGVAPVAVSTIFVNGAQWTLNWTSLTNWRVSLPLGAGTNYLTVEGIGRNGLPIAGDSNSVTVVNSAAAAPPAGFVVINEVMSQPAVSNAEYLELYNNSTSNAFDLSNWQLPALGYTFPEGAWIGPNSYMVLASNRAAFAAAYGATIPVFDTFSGALAPGQLLSLTEPSGGSNVPVAQVLFDDAAPWPSSTGGVSLQLVDSHQDNWREGNWRTGSPSFTPGASNSVAAILPPFPALWINEVEPDNLTGITNSAGQHAPWLELYNPGSNAIMLTNLYLTATYANLTNWAFPPGAVIAPGQFLVIFADGQTNLSTLSQLHTS